MSQSFSLSAPLADLEPKRRRVLVTGAAGNIGSFFAAKTHHKYDLRLMVRADDDVAALEGLGEIVVGELSEGKTVMSHALSDQSQSGLRNEVAAARSQK